MTAHKQVPHLERFLGGIEKRGWEQRTASYSGAWKEMMDEARPRILEKIEQYDATH